MCRVPLNLPHPNAGEIVEGKAAIAETAAVAGGVDLSSRAALNKVNALLRRDKMDNHVHLLLVIGLYFVGACILVIFGSLVWNMTFPNYRFLDETQAAKLEAFLFSGALGSAVTAAARKVSGLAPEQLPDKD